MTGEKIFLGLDIGTNSVGWAVTDENYNLRKFNNNLMWGVSLFDEAEQSAERRAFRSARRRLGRRKQRISLLQDFFAKEIIKKDENFFLRLKESALLPEDSEHRTKNIYFDDADFTDKDYFKKYPTIHHLISELINDPSEHDVRLIYIACAYILAHRGHFLYAIDKDNAEKIKDFSVLYDEFIVSLKNLCEELPFDSSGSELSEILRSGKSTTEKKKSLKEIWFGGKAPKKDISDSLNFDSLISLISGGKVKLSDLFLNDEYTELEKNSITLSAADFSETLDSMQNILEEDQWTLLNSAKKISDWALLINSLGKHNYISEAKVDVYETHKSDLKDLKEICKKYLSPESYKAIFKDMESKSNYVSYINNSSVKLCSQEDFCKFVQKHLKELDCKAEDKPKLDKLLEKCENKTLCPKQVTTDNRVIPYQLYYTELKTILKNASSYLPFLNESDKYGTVVDKILSIMEFRIPYYVGPLVSSEKSKFAWMQRKAEGKIYPWNYHELIDLDKTEDAFIRRMTCKCTYLAGEDVLPKNSLLYCKYNVLNEINNIAVDGRKISVEAKQTIYQELFMKKQRVTLKNITDCLKARGEFADDKPITGIDKTVKSSLKPYLDFKKLLDSKTLSEADVERIIERITITTDVDRLKKWLKENYPKLPGSDIKYISGLNYKDYVRLSRRLLEEIFEVDKSTKEICDNRNIITRLWETNDNLMQLLSINYKYNIAIEDFNAAFYSQPENNKTLPEKMKDMYVPTAVRRSITRTLDIVKEIKSIVGRDPDKIFIETARGSDGSKKGKREKSRQEKIEELLKSAKKMIGEERYDKLNDQLTKVDNGKLRSEKYFLYFMQLGRSMYSGKPIEFSELDNNYMYNIDHIWPQAKIKDDSFDNKVLVESEANGEKGNNYPISSEIRHKMYSFWKGLKEKELISEKKFQRLIRSTPFSNEELANFIARQLVETQQSTKVSADFIKELCPDSKLVYVKARLVSDFRQEMNMPKCREVNDLHHAKDAYLNIVLGNVYSTQFTDNYLNFVKEHKNYSLKMLGKNSEGKQTGLLTRKVSRKETVAWDPDTSFDIVRKTMGKNSIRYVRYCYRRKGGLFNQLPEKKNVGLVERKKGLDTSKYGGYNNTAAAYYTLVKYGKSLVFVPIDVMFSEKCSADAEFALKYAAKQLSDILSKPVDENKLYFPLKNRIVKINTMLEFDGFRCSLIKKLSNGRQLGISSAVSLVLGDNHYNYAKTISSFAEKRKMDKNRSADDYPGINRESNMELFDLLTAKTEAAPFNIKFSNIGATFKAGRKSFSDLPLTEQAVVLTNILSVFKTGRSAGCDLKLIGASSNAGIFTLNSNIAKIKGEHEIHIIDQSPTGLFEKRSPDLLKL